MDNRKHFIAPSLLAILLIVALVWGYNQNQIRKQHEIALENSYQRLFFDVKKHVENVQVNLSKALVASSKERNVLLLSQIVSEANSAHSKLGQLPLTHDEIGNTEKFLNQAADYSTYLIQRHLEGEDLTQDQREALNGLQDNSTKFNMELEELQGSMADNTFLLGAMSSKQGQKIQEGNENIFQTSLVNLDQQFSKSPELIYDGPFADQMLNRKPVGLPENEVNQQEAAKNAQAFFNGNVVSIEAFEEGANISESKMPAYTFHLFPENGQKDLPVYMGVSRKGGKVLWMVNPRSVIDGKMTEKEAEERAKQYLRSKGFDNMEPNYYLKYNGSILFNFTSTENDIRIYPDLVKVKVALDNGEVVGFDASAYYMNHKNREYLDPVITLEEARSKVKINFDVFSETLALIPKGKDEILCYEFKGKYNDSDFIIYINSQTGREEQILQIIKDENGTLTF